MTTQCNGKLFEFEPAGKRKVVADFDGGTITTDAGVLLLREVEAKTAMIRQFAERFTDHRDPELIEQTVPELVAQRVIALAAGYEDLNDHDELRRDPLMAVAVGKTDPTGQRRARERDKGKPPAGKSTLNRLELTLADATPQARYKKIVAEEEKLDRLFVELFPQAREEPPEEIILDLDATDDPPHGKQEGRFFHGYYRQYCCLPMCIFCGDFLLSARLRTSAVDPAVGALEDLKRAVGQIREKWPDVKILARGDSGFCRDGIMSWREAERVDCVFGLAKNRRLLGILGEELAQAKEAHEQTGKAERVYRDFRCQTLKSWTGERRVVGKAEHLAKGANPRFVATSLGVERYEAQAPYEDAYCARGEMENRIKEQQGRLFADRTSSATIRANQTRLCFSSVAYVLMEGLRRLGLKGTELAQAQCDTIRLKLLKIGAQVKVTARRVIVNMAQGYPYERIFQAAYESLRGLRPLRC